MSSAPPQRSNTLNSGNQFGNKSVVGEKAFNPVSPFNLTQPYHSMVRDGYFTFSLEFSSTQLTRAFKATAKAVKVCPEMVIDQYVSSGDVLEFARIDGISKKSSGITKGDPKEKAGKLRPKTSLCSDDFDDTDTNFNERIKEVATDLGTSVIGRIRAITKLSESISVLNWWNKSTNLERLTVVTSQKYREQIVKMAGYEDRMQKVACPFRGPMAIEIVAKKPEGQAPAASSSST